MTVNRSSLQSYKRDAELPLSVKGDGLRGGGGDGGRLVNILHGVAIIDKTAQSQIGGECKDLPKSMNSSDYSKPPLPGGEEEEEEGEDHPSIRQLVVRYASKSTVHGLPSTVSHSLYTGQRYFWFSLVFLMGVALTVAITLQLKSYYEWPTVVNIQEVPTTSDDIPKVTICDQESLGFTFIKKPWSVSPRDLGGGTYVSVYSETLLLSNHPNCTHSRNQSGRCLLDKATSTERSRLLTFSLDRGGWIPPGDKYYPQVVTSMGVCNTFNTSMALQDVQNKPQSARVPLELVLAVKPTLKERIMKGIRTGIQLTLHDKEEPPFPTTRRVFLPVGSSCLVQYKKITRKSLTTPYKSFIGEQCVELSNFRNPLSRYSVYTKDTCLAECFVNFTIAQCGCRYYLHPGSEEMCTSDQTLSCMEKTTAAFSEHKKTCGCSPPCEESEFETYLSCSKIARAAHPMVHIEVMSSAEVKTEITQVPVYTFESIMGSLGGLIGLFMGFSLVSLMEFVELIVIAFSRCCRIGSRKHRM